MPAIILEGPDESGKTMLATALYGYTYPNSVVTKSPAASPLWHDEYGMYVQKHLGRNDGRTWIFDRVPEISELVYGAVKREAVRLADPMQSLKSLRHPKVMVIACRRSGIHIDQHHDAEGDFIDASEHDQIVGGYKVAFELLRSHGVKMIGWDWQEKATHWTNITLAMFAYGFGPRNMSLVENFDEAYEVGRERIDGSSSSAK